MAYTLDIIYKFIADTKQFQKEMKDIEQGTGKVAANVQAPDYKKVESELRNVSREITRLRDTGQISVEQAAKLKTQYKEAAKEAQRLANALDAVIRKRGQFAPGVTPELKQQLKGVGGPGMGQYEGGYVPGEMEDFADAMERTFRQTNKGVIDLRTNTQATEGAMRQFATEFQMGMHRTAEVTQQASTEITHLDATAKKGSASLEQLGRALMVKGFSFYGLRLVGASVTQIGQMASILGGAATAGVFKGASEYVKNAKETNEVTRAWAKEMNRVEDSQARIGKVLASQTIPFLQKGADLLAKLAGYLERNPEAVGKLVKGGLALTGIGALIMAVGKGINLISDTAFIIAATQMALSGKENIIASGVMKRSSSEMLMAAAEMNVATKTGGGTGALAFLGKAGVILAAVSAAAIGTDRVFDAIEKRDVKFADYMTELKQFLSLGAGGAGWMSAKISNVFRPASMEVDENSTGQKWFKAVAEALGLIEQPAKTFIDSMEGISDVLANSLKRDEAVQAFEDYKADDLDLLRKFYADRKKVELDSQNAILKANKSLADGLAKALTDQASAISKATADYKKDDLKAEAKYQEDRKKILEDSKEDVLKQEEDLQKKLRKLREDYEEREADLLAARDAVGLIKNRQKFIKDSQEAQREANEEIAKRRQDARKRLEELQTQYEEDRKQRYNDWVEKVKEIQQQTKLEMDELRKKHAEELREIAINRNARLAELNTQLTEDRKRRYNAFIAQIRDLDAALLGESNLRKQYQANMLKDLDAFLARYRAGLSNLTAAVPSRQTGGYVGNGVYQLHAGEFVLNPSTTQALESMIGQKLSQGSVLQWAGMSSRTQVVWNDTRRFDSRLGAADRRMITNDTLGVLNSVIGG